MKELSGKTAFVTGAASGIGLALSQALAAEGMQVVLADVEEEPLRKAIAHLTDEGYAVLGNRLDVSQKEEVFKALKQAQNHFGNIHVLCNNAGVGSVLKWEEQSYETVEWVMNVNFGGVFHGVRAFLPHMKAHGEGGHIINTASILG
ncbi:MAG: SDR family NAD(P)-dependent oxidoreductase, partial [Myxococcota bacterium]|nr:SDR family NAD(P)-dependent oxidoreductase [Myxococcota bacterium]